MTVYVFAISAIVSAKCVWQYLAVGMFLYASIVVERERGVAFESGASFN